MKSTPGWLVDAHGRHQRAVRYRFGAVPVEQIPKYQIPTLIDLDVAGAAMPGIWAFVICVYSGIASSGVWFLGVPVSLGSAFYGVVLLAIMRSRARARALRVDHRFTRSAVLCPANAYLQSVTQSLDIAPSRSSAKTWLSLANAVNALAGPALLVDAADHQIAQLHAAHLAGIMPIEEYRFRAWEPWVRVTQQRGAITQVTQDCHQLAVTSGARANIAALRTGTPQVTPRPIATGVPVGAHLQDLLGVPIRASSRGASSSRNQNRH